MAQLRTFTPTTPLGYINDELSQLYGGAGDALVSLAETWYVTSGGTKGVVSTGEHVSVSMPDTGTGEVQFNIHVPPHWRGVEVTAQLLGEQATTGAGVVRGSIRVLSLIPGSAPTQELNTGVDVTASGTGGETQLDDLGSFTIPDDTEALGVRLRRVAGHANDTLVDPFHYIRFQLVEA